MPGFWDAMTPAYRRLPPPVPIVPTISVDNVGQALVGGVVALTVVHGGATIVRSRVARSTGRRRAAKAAAAATAKSAEPAAVGEGRPGDGDEAGRPGAAGPTGSEVS
jgi:hypothetical protein